MCNVFICDVTVCEAYINSVLHILSLYIHISLVFISLMTKCPFFIAIVCQYCVLSVCLVNSLFVCHSLLLTDSVVVL